MFANDTDNSRPGLIRALFQTLSILRTRSGDADAMPVAPHIGASNLARTIAQLMSLDSEVVDCVRMAGLLHDIAGIDLPEEVVVQRGPLDPEQQDMVSQHTNGAAEMLADIDFPWAVQTVLLQHHERRDGSGYPAGLNKDDLLLESQILTVADIVCTMTRAESPDIRTGSEAAIALLRDGRETLFNPAAVDACVSLLEKTPEMLSGTFWRDRRGR